MSSNKKLYRSSSDRWIDPAVVRLGYVLFSLISASFPGLLIYIILWLIMPKY